MVFPLVSLVGFEFNEPFSFAISECAMFLSLKFVFVEKEDKGVKKSCEYDETVPRDKIIYGEGISLGLLVWIIIKLLF